MVEGNDRFVLVTGASTGIGHCIVRYLSERGHRVYATVRREEDMKRLGEIERVTPLELDVRETAQVREAVNFVLARRSGLYGLVNNAGLGELGPLACWTDDEVRDIFEVNVFGPVRLTNAFLPLLLEARGRVVNIGSQGGVLAKKYYGPYCMTKHALEAYTDTLDEELERYGVRASIVQPGGIVSNMGTNSMPGTIARFKRARAPFADEAAQVLAALEQAAGSNDDGQESETNRKPSSPEVVAAAVYDALFSARPKRRYLVGTQWEGDRVLNTLVGQLLDENDNPRHNYSREQLVAMLDRHFVDRASGGS